MFTTIALIFRELQLSSSNARAATNNNKIVFGLCLDFMVCLESYKPGIFLLKVLKDASRKAETNVAKLKNESSRLESHLHKGTNWWLWIAIAVVCFTFLFMIVFIRFFPKPR